eukprot:9320857-Pyramimonas_sp.AAC.1
MDAAGDPEWVDVEPSDAWAAADRARLNDPRGVRNQRRSLHDTNLPCRCSTHISPRARPDQHFEANPAVATRAPQKARNGETEGRVDLSIHLPSP